MDGDFLLGVMFAVTMFSGVFVIFLAMRQRSETLERQHRERMAMIERGQVPPPAPSVARRGAPSTALSFGIVTVGVGFALMMLISVASGEPDVGVGVGGAIVIVGAAFIVRSIVVRPSEAERRVPAIPPAPPEERL
ncbi:MAG TPA: DUF6249 domain-containing protein [Vicinamibacterales bacterium]|nr:DUF6249 domain-containing protein [Vicinamibacterales bacterium]